MEKKQRVPREGAKLSERDPWTSESAEKYLENALLRVDEGSQATAREFVQWLRAERHLATESISLRIVAAGRFMHAISRGDGAVASLKQLTVRQVEDYFVSYSRDRNVSGRRQMQSALRLLLRFAAHRGWLVRDAHEWVPPIRTYRLGHVPAGLKDDDVNRLLASLGDEGTCARDRAILLILVCYGVRRGQVASLRLDEIRWRERLIHFRPQKGGKSVAHVLLPAVADALVQYIQTERAPVQNPMVFLRQLAPFLPVSPQAVTLMVTTKLKEMNVDAGQCRPHALRHAFATRLLRAGQPIKAIADLLGHRSLTSTSVYAKVSHPQLMEIAMDWPEVVA